MFVTSTILRARTLETTHMSFKDNGIKETLEYPQIKQYITDEKKISN